MVDGPVLVLEKPAAFGIIRLQVKVAAGETACVEYRTAGMTRASWRTGKSPSPGGTWTDALPDRLTGDSLFVVTATSRDATFDLEVTDVGDDPDCGDEAPTPSVEPSDCGICGRSRYFIDMAPAN